MIFIAVGTQDKQFLRILKVVDNAISKGIVKEEVIAQAGSTKFISDNMKVYDFIPSDEINEYTSRADLIVCHGGVGIITDALKKNKKVFVMPRLKEYKEHRNDHQLQIAEKFEKLGYIKLINSYDDFVKEYKNLDKFKPKKPKFGSTTIIDMVSDFIG